MNGDPTITISLDYLVDVTDDGTQAEPEVLVLPPPPRNADPPAAPEPDSK